MFIRTSDFDVTNPEELRRDLQQQDRNIEAAFAELQVPILGTKIRKVNSSDTARFGEMLVVDTSDGSIIIGLPQIGANRQASTGRGLGIMRSSTANVLTLAPSGNDLINNASTYTVAATFGLYLVVFDGTNYWVR
jgi:hypothetical protein